MAGRWQGRFYNGDDTDERVEGRPSGAISMDGEGGDDTLLGGGGNDGITGGEGDDHLDGGVGNDDLDAQFPLAGGGDDRAFGRSGDDYLTGGSGADLLDGGSGDDTVAWDRDDDGGSPRFTDTLVGGEGDDVLMIAADRSFAIDFALGAAADIVADGRTAATTTGFERLIFDGTEYFTEPADHRVAGGGSADRLIAGAGDDTLAGLGGSDSIDGGEGANVLAGGAGDDFLRIGVDRQADAVSGGRGDDLLNLDDFFVRSERLVVERVAGMVVARVDGEVVAQATSIERLDVEGGGGDDSLMGLSGDDRLSGGNDRGGADTLRGGGGDDLLFGASGGDRLFGGAGRDTAYVGDFEADVEVTLIRGETVTAFVDGVAEARLSGVENLVGGSGNDRLTGDSGANVIEGVGLFSHDTLDGGRGADTLSVNTLAGRLDITLGGPDFVTAESRGYTVTHRNFENVVGTQGRDAITGDDAANRLDGWHAADTLTGGGGADVFVFSSFDPEADGADTVVDFSRRDGDRIDLLDFVASTRNGDFTAETFIGEAAFSGKAGEVRFEAGETSRLQIDYNGNGSADFEILFANGADIGARDVII